MRQSRRTTQSSSNANARRLVEQRYDWDAIGRRFVALVEDVVRQRSGG